MKLQKQNVIYTVTDPAEIEALKAKGFKEIKKAGVQIKDKEPNKREG